jgi:hypothetical protein
MRVRRLAAALVVVVAATGCSDELSDREGGAGLRADEVADTYDVTVYRNIDSFPNVAIFCADGLAFYASSQSSSSRGSLGRLPERDERCAR